MTEAIVGKMNLPCLGTVPMVPNLTHAAIDFATAVSSPFEGYLERNWKFTAPSPLVRLGQPTWKVLDR